MTSLSPSANGLCVSQESFRGTGNLGVTKTIRNRYVRDGHREHEMITSLAAQNHEVQIDLLICCYATRRFSAGTWRWLEHKSL